MIRVKGLSVHAGQFSLCDVSFEVPAGGYSVLMGKTGTGKTTVLEAIAGLKRVSAGRIVLGTTDVTRLKPAQRNIGYVPQDGALFPTLTVGEHLAFALVIRRADEATIQRRSQELARLLEIEHLLHRRPLGLSGGEKQRVAIGRALACWPTTLLLDEPLSALDEETREQMYKLLAHVRQHTKVTVLHVTHNREEAVRLADQLLVLQHGSVEIRPIVDSHTLLSTSREEAT